MCNVSNSGIVETSAASRSIGNRCSLLKSKVNEHSLLEKNVQEEKIEYETIDFLGFDINGSYACRLLGAINRRTDHCGR